MSSVHHLREFISERLTAAAEEIFREFQKTIVQYEEEIDRQRRLLDITWRPQIKLIRTDVPQQHVLKEEKKIVTEQQLCPPERSSGWDQLDPPRIKEEQEELCISQKGTQEPDTFMVPLSHEECGPSQPETNSGMVSSEDSSVGESRGQDRDHLEGPGSTTNPDFQPEPHHSNPAENTPHSGKCPKANRDKGQHFCNVCGKCFARNANLMAHMRVHTGEKPYTCPTCGKSFSHHGSFFYHIGTHKTEKLHSCEICGKNFRIRRYLLTHMRVHTGEKPYTCPTCGKSFSHHGSFFYHIGTHKTEKLHSCEICGKNFRIRRYLLNHMRIHTGEKPYTCKTCGKHFCHNSSLFYHMIAHHGARPYACKICGKCFNRKTVLLAHIKIHTRETLVDKQLQTCE